MNSTIEKQTRKQNSWGILWGIGTGHGKAEWLTIEGLKILQSVPVVAMPQNIQGEAGMAYQIVKDYIQPQQTILPLALPFVTDREILDRAWDNAAKELISILAKGQDIAFIAEGDISFYSTFTYIARSVNNLAPSVQIEAIPGICSPLAAAAALKIPLSIGNEKIAILPALYSIAELEKALDWAEVVISSKLSSVFSEVWQLLAQKHLLEQASLVEWIGGPKEKIFPNLLGLENYQPPYFSILLVRHQRILLSNE